MRTSVNTHRLFIVDHMCVLPFGHNLNAVVLFEKELRKYFSDSVCLVCKGLPDYAEQAKLVKRELSFPYDGVLEPPQRTKSGGDESATRRTKNLGNLFRNRMLRKSVYTALFEGVGLDVVSRRTITDWKSVFKKHAISRSDSIFFPSAEYYGCTTLLELLGQMSAEECPSVHLRLIGVGENARYSLSPARPVFIEAIRKAKMRGVRVSVSAETPRYVEHLRNLLDMDVIFMPYPIASERKVVAWGKRKIIASPGQGRADKGFFRLYPIIGELLKNAPHRHFEYDVQNMRVQDRDHRPRYESSLGRIPLMKLRAARLSQDEINEVYAQSDIMLLPYDEDTYALRGSAVYQETLAVGRPVVTSRNLGFSELVVRYGNGLLADSDTEFANAIDELSSWNKARVDQVCRDARKLFEQDANSAFSSVAEVLQS